jgi:hypothetical protein
MRGNLVKLRSLFCSLAVLISTALPAKVAAQNIDDPFQIDTVSELRFNCAAYSRLLNGRRLDDQDDVRIATCMSFVPGVVNGMQIGGAVAGGRAICPPADLSVGQEIQIFMNWSDAQPERWNDRAGVGVGRAMLEAFPCR